MERVSWHWSGIAVQYPTITLQEEEKLKKKKRLYNEKLVTSDLLY